MSNGEMSFFDFRIAIKWLCDISRQYGDHWLLNQFHTTCAVCWPFSINHHILQ